VVKLAFFVIFVIFVIFVSFVVHYRQKSYSSTPCFDMPHGGVLAWRSWAC